MKEAAQILGPQKGRTGDLWAVVIVAADGRKFALYIIFSQEAPTIDSRIY